MRKLPFIGRITPTMIFSGKIPRHLRLGSEEFKTRVIACAKGKDKEYWKKFFNR